MSDPKQLVDCIDWIAIVAIVVFVRRVICIGHEVEYECESLGISFNMNRGVGALDRRYVSLHRHGSKVSANGQVNDPFKDGGLTCWPSSSTNEL